MEANDVAMTQLLSRKRGVNLLDIQKDLLRKGELMNEQVTATWSENRIGQLLIDAGFKVVPAFRIEPYVFDLKLLDFPLLIEVDGEVHNQEVRRNKDYVKDRFAMGKGFRVVRFRNSEDHSVILSDLREITRNLNMSPKMVWLYPLSIKEQLKDWFKKILGRSK